MIDIIINIEHDSYTLEVKDALAEALRTIIKPFLDENNIKSLKRIIVPEDFSKEITAFQIENNLPVEQTNGAGGKAVAKTFKVNEKEQVIFYEKNYFASIFMQDEVGIGLLFHELSHIFYNEVIADKYKDRLKLYRISIDVLDNLNEASYILWEEYFVSRYLVKYYPNGLDKYMDFLISEYNRIKKNINSDINEYRKTNSSRNISEQLTTLSKYIVYPLGMIAGIEENYDNFNSSNYHDMIKKELPEIFDIWNTMSIKFDTLYTAFPKLDNSFDILDDITDAYLKLFECFGIKVIINGYEFHFEIT